MKSFFQILQCIFNILPQPFSFILYLFGVPFHRLFNNCSPSLGQLELLHLLFDPNLTHYLLDYLELVFRDMLNMSCLDIEDIAAELGEPASKPLEQLAIQLPD